MSRLESLEDAYAQAVAYARRGPKISAPQIRIAQTIFEHLDVWFYALRTVEPTGTIFYSRRSQPTEAVWSQACGVGRLPS